jgi:hypothetical protein
LNPRLESLFFLCRCIKPELGADEIKSIRNIILSGGVDWDNVVVLANEQFVVTALWSGLRDKGLERILPSGLRLYLKELHKLNLDRNEAIRQQVAELVGCLNRAGSSPVLLKGAALIYAGIFEDSAARIMTDIDIMIRENDRDKVLEALFDIGYAYLEDSENYENCQHLPPMTKNGAPAVVELHNGLFDKLADVEILTASEVWSHSTAINMNGLSFYLMSPTQWILYNIGHSEIHHLNYSLGKLSIRDLLDFTAIFGRYSNDIDWAQIKNKMRSNNVEKVLRSYVYAASRLFGTPVPSDLKPALTTVLYFARNLILLRAPCVRNLQNWLVRTRLNLRRLFRLAFTTFGAQKLRTKYGCKDNVFDLTKTRVQHCWYLLNSCIRGPHRYFVWPRLPGNERTGREIKGEIVGNEKPQKQ